MKTQKIKRTIKATHTVDECLIALYTAKCTNNLTPRHKFKIGDVVSVDYVSWGERLLCYALIIEQGSNLDYGVYFMLGINNGYATWWIDEKNLTFLKASTPETQAIVLAIKQEIETDEYDEEEDD